MLLANNVSTEIWSSSHSQLHRVSIDFIYSFIFAKCQLLCCVKIYTQVNSIKTLGVTQLYKLPVIDV